MNKPSQDPLQKPVVMRDFFKNILEVGDVVAFIPVGYRDLHQGRIVAFTDKKVRISYRDQYKQTEETLRYPTVLIKHVKAVSANPGQGV